MEFKKTDPKVADIVRKTYPQYRGRRPVKVQSRERYRVADYWSEGSRTYAQFMHLPTRRLIQPEQMGYEQQKMNNPFNQRIGSVTLTPDTAVVEESIFRGKSMGIRIYLHPETYTAWEQGA